jgi:NAD+ synthase
MGATVAGIDQTAPVAVEDITASIVAWLQEKLEQSGANGFVLGLSGGIDSAVVSGLCARAAGPDRVTGVIMPSASNPDDADCAQAVADAFGIRCPRVDLTGIADSIYAVVPSLKDLGVDDAAADALARRQQLATANVRPRLRMTTLYYIANLTGGIVTGTGNKSEASIGYFTKYGDGGVDLFPIIDLYKFEVRAVAKYIGVPDVVIQRPPSAGLWQGQTDEAEIGMSYDTLDASLIAIAAGREADVDPAILARLKPLMKASEHKRKPVPAFLKSEHGL